MRRRACLVHSYPTTLRTVFPSVSHRKSCCGFPARRCRVCGNMAFYGDNSTPSLKTRAVTTTTETAPENVRTSENPDGSVGTTVFVAQTNLPTSSGEMKVFAYRHTHEGKTTEPIVIVSGDVNGAEDAPCRVHDACFTGEVLGSQKCDCAQQLKIALEYIKENSPGLVIYLQQEGRGIGLANKIHAYRLQEVDGLDTVDANRALGLPDDCREYSAVHNILDHLGVKSVALLTNNPRKIDLLQSLGIEVSSRIPVVVPKEEMVGPLASYLRTKANRMRHQFESDEFP
mmetsp:Transcript_6248/g.23026  ORF Transcript_6248/g.23026 Transcript_6248/m.23026 type:complete len:286 (+) Transcript_6248:1209-2066(+)